MRYKLLRSLFLATTIVFFGLSLSAQNLVRNPNFTELDSCPYTFGQIYFANHWSSDNDQSPDLYDSCVTAPFFGLPIVFPCTTITPYQDNGFVGIVTLGRWPNGDNIREIMTARLDAVPPEGVDIYCSIAVKPRPRCESPDDIPNYLCYSNGVGLAIIYENQTREIVVQAKQVIDDIDNWKILKGCYESKGEEQRVQIQNFFDNSQTDRDCIFINEDNNISYTYVDNVVVAPFDILPDTLIICDIQEIQFEGIEFYDLALSWSDGIQEGEREFELSGTYTLWADAEDCILEESIVVIVADEEVVDLEQVVTKCENESLTLTLEIPGEIAWSNNQTGSTLTILSAGTYIAELTTECNMLEFIYTIREIDCTEVIYAANIFTPNGDGVNDKIQFYLNPILTIDGTIMIFDRWGVLVFQSSSIQELEWEGKSNTGIDLNQGVYVWTFVSQDQTLTQSGDITLIR